MLKAPPLMFDWVLNAPLKLDTNIFHVALQCIKICDEGLETLLVQSQPWKRKTNMWNLYKVYCKDNRTTSWRRSGQKQTPEVFLKRGVLKTFAIFTGKHQCWSLFLVKLQIFRPETLFKKDYDICVFLWV